MTALLIRKIKLGEAGTRFRVGDTVIEIKRVTETRVHLACDGPDAIEWFDAITVELPRDNHS